MFEKLKAVEERYEEVGRQLMQPEIVSDQTWSRNIGSM